MPTRATTVSMEGSPDSSHAYRSWRARARALVSGRCTEPLDGGGGLERRLRGLRSLAHPCQCLLLVFSGEHAEPHGDPVRERDVSQAARRLAGDVLEVRRLAA